MGKKVKKYSVYYDMQVKSREPGNVCGKCGRMSDYMTVDHIVPMFFIDMVGLRADVAYDDQENYELLCRSCNLLKGHKFDFTNPKTIPIMRKYMTLLEQIHQPPICEPQPQKSSVPLTPDSDW